MKALAEDQPPKHFNAGNDYARKPVKERRTERVSVYFTPGESVRYQSQADKAGMPIAQWIRIQLAQSIDV